MAKFSVLCLIFSFSFFSAYSHAGYKECIILQLSKAKDTETVGQIKQQCKKETEIEVPENAGAIGHRIIHEIETEQNPYVLTPHLMNYILPATYYDKINIEPYEPFGLQQGDLNHTEAKFQLSIKVPLFQNNNFIKFDAFYFGMTIKSFWQAYAKNVSAPFRETNYKPEIFYLAPLPFHPFEGNAGFVLGMAHESNGQSKSLSRSWNKFYGGFLYEKNNFALSITPWVRIHEPTKKTPSSAYGDDNPDLEDYLGHFQLTSVYVWDDYQLNLQARQNFRTRKGALELGFTFPLSGRLRGYIQYFNGYGESLIDYNHQQQRFGIGLALTDFL